MDFEVLVILESPYAGDEYQVKANIYYAQRCMRDCFMRGEIPFASHLLYTQDGILDDEDPEEREMGIKAGFAWRKFTDKTVVYVDMGITKGMKQGMESAKKMGHKIELRSIE